MNIKDLFPFFPVLEPPISITENAILEISKNNSPLPLKIIEHFFTKWESHWDEFTEFIPCFNLAVSDNLVCLVYWKGQLLSHHFNIVTLNLKGELISKKTIAGIISDGKDVARSVAVINEDFTIHVAVSNEKGDSKTNLFYLEILDSGEIISMKEEDKLWEDASQN